MCKKNLTLRLEKSMIDELKEVAKENHTTITHEIRQATLRMLKARKGVRL